MVTTDYKKKTIVTISSLTVVRGHLVHPNNPLLPKNKSVFHFPSSEMGQVNALATTGDCFDPHTPLAMARFPITSPPVARA